MRCMGCMRNISDESKNCPYCGFDNNQQNDERCLKIGSVISGRYIIGKSLGSGGFGITYIAWDSMTKKAVAIKEYFPSESVVRDRDSNYLRVTDENHIRRFESGKRKAIEESRCLAALDNIESVADVYDCIEENNTAYIIMEYLEGITLKELLNEREVLSFPEALKIITPVMDSLSRVHKTGLIHRDISPDNIFICNDGKIKILDFGSARYSMSENEKTYTIVLKHGFAPVEQYSAHSSQGPWTDVYAVAATLYKMITGKRPMDSLERVNNDTLPSPRQLGVQLPPYADEAIMRALWVNEKGRTRTMLSFKKGLLGQEVRQNNYREHRLEDDSVPEKPYNHPEEKQTSKGKKAALIIIAAVVIVAIAVAAAVFSAGDKEKETTTLARATTAVSTTAESTTRETTASQTTKETTTEETTAEETTVSEYASLTLSENPAYVYRRDFVFIQETLTLYLSEIPADGGRILCEVEDKSIADVTVIGNLVGEILDNNQRTVIIKGKAAGKTTAHFYVEKYPEISVDLSIDVLPDSNDEKTQPEKGTKASSGRLF